MDTNIASQPEEEMKVDPELKMMTLEVSEEPDQDAGSDPADKIAS